MLDRGVNKKQKVPKKVVRRPLRGCSEKLQLVCAQLSWKTQSTRQTRVGTRYCERLSHSLPSCHETHTGRGQRIHRREAREVSQCTDPSQQPKNRTTDVPTNILAACFTHSPSRPSRNLTKITLPPCQAANEMEPLVPSRVRDRALRARSDSSTLSTAPLCHT